MTLLIFIAGLVLGALAAFVFIFIVMGVTTHKKPAPKIDFDSETLLKYWQEYLKEEKLGEQKTGENQL